MCDPNVRATSKANGPQILQHVVWNDAANLQREKLSAHQHDICS